MKLNPIRRGQLITPFGPGALHVLRNGISVITAGLDHWFETNDGTKIQDVDTAEFRIDEWRLSRELNVNHFMAPPEFRIPSKSGDSKNTLLKIPVLRFPAWYVCPKCGLMKKDVLHCAGYVNCTDCKRRMIQVRFIAMCDQGHVQDFPWLEWVHRSAEPACIGPLRYTATGGGSLSTIKISCRACGEKRTLENVTAADPTGQSTYLSSNLLRETGNVYLCKGFTPWMGTENGGDCNRPLRAALRSATNVYYSDIKSAIYLPFVLFSEKNNATDILKTPQIKTFLNIRAEDEPDDLLKPLRKKYKDLLQDLSDGEIAEAIEIIRGLRIEGTGKNKQKIIEGEDRWTSFRRLEFSVLSAPHNEDDLLTVQADTTGLSTVLKKYIDKIMLVERLRETRVLAGFSRVIPESGLAQDQKKALLRRNKPEEGKYWLPACKVYGEGIFITLREDVLRQWEFLEPVKNRAEILNRQYLKVCAERGFNSKAITARFILIHTLSHLLINRLTFECGYSSASLRERLYVSNNADAPMAGFLIYTSSGDAEGTMGGLVRMGKTENFEPLFRRALENATWCSADPVCGETGDYGGQGPDSCNLAACHNCCLVPETSCEEFNRFLDRCLVVPTAADNKHGFLIIN